jgi:hypothetical protein
LLFDTQVSGNLVLVHQCLRQFHFHGYISFCEKGSDTSPM